MPIRNNKDTIAIFSEYGCGKKTPIEEFSVQARAGKGIVAYKVTPATGNVIGAAMISNEDNILLVGKTSICIAATDIPLLGRAAIGNVMIKQGQLSSITKI